MPRTYGEIVAALGRGDAIRGVALTDPAQRRMFRFLLASPDRSQGNFSDGYIRALKDAFTDGDTVEEPPGGGAPTPPGGEPAPPSRWMLHRVEATNFGGVTAYGAPPFVLEVGGESLCLDGHNGQGKTSIASLVMVGLTGQRLGIHGPSAQACAAHQVRDATGKANALTWPPVISYPATFAQLQSAEPEATIRLVFRNLDGQEHVTERTINRAGVHPKEPSLPPGVTPLHVELSVLVPNRVADVRVNEETRLVEVLVELIGLEPLRALGEHAYNLCHRSKNFVGHPRKADIDASLRLAEGTLSRVFEAEAAEGLLPRWSSPAKEVQEPGLPDALAAAERTLVQRKSELFAAVKVAATLNLSRAADLSRVQQQLSKVDDLLAKDGEVLLQSLSAMGPIKKVASFARQEQLATARRAVANASTSLEAARIALARQRNDGRLRLKAMAAVWHRDNHPDAGPVEDCPLCGRSLSGDAELEALAGEIARLRSEGDAVTRGFQDVCEGIAHRLGDELADLGVTEDLPIDPVGDLLRELSERLEANEALGLILAEARGVAVEAIRSLDRGRPLGTPPSDEAPAPAEERLALAAIARAERAIALAEAWSEAKTLLGRVREEVLGKAEEAAPTSHATLRRALEAVQRVSDKAAPIDEALDRIARARAAQKSWLDLQNERATRERVASAIAPLKELVRLVEDEARETLTDVTDGTVELFGRIYAGGPLALKGAAFDRRSTLQVEGRVGEALVDASHIANTSWLRAFLWAFAFTLRRQAVARLGHDPLPLLLLDDPQATFDNCNERQWAALLAEMSAERGEKPAEAQLLVTSHDPKLFERYEFKGDYVGNRGAVCGINPNTGVLRVFRGDLHLRAWEKFERDPRPETAQDYISEVRLIVEGKLSLILHVFNGHPGTTELEKLRQAFEKQKDLPFFRTPEVQAISNALRTDKTFRDNLNASHHEADRRTLNENDARSVKAGWGKLEELIEAACDQARRFEVFGPRRMPSAEILTFPAPRPLRLTSKVADRELVLGGRVAAATGGRVAWGDADAGEHVRLVRHGAVRLLAETLAPMSTAGDILILRRFGIPQDGDLVVADVGGALRARRLRLVGEDRSQAALLAEPLGAAADPPLLVAEVTDAMRIVDGVLFAETDGTRGAGPRDEVVALQRDVDVLAHAGSGGSVWRVTGESAVPVALDGQYLLVGNRVGSRPDLERLDGRMVFAEVDGQQSEPERYFKRMRLASEMVVLESIERTGQSPPILCTLGSERRFPRLLSAAPVRGVFFKCQS